MKTVLSTEYDQETDTTTVHFGVTMMSDYPSHPDYMWGKNED